MLITKIDDFDRIRGQYNNIWLEDDIETIETSDDIKYQEYIHDLKASLPLEEIYTSKNCPYHVPGFSVYKYTCEHFSKPLWILWDEDFDERIFEPLRALCKPINGIYPIDHIDGIGERKGHLCICMAMDYDDCVAKYYEEPIIEALGSTVNIGYRYFDDGTLEDMDYEFYSPVYGDSWRLHLTYDPGNGCFTNNNEASSWMRTLTKRARRIYRLHEIKLMSCINI